MIVSAFEYLRRNRLSLWLGLTGVTIVLAVLVAGQRYKEDFSAFLPLDSKYQRALSTYQQLSAARKVFVLFQTRDTTRTEPDSIVAAIDDFALTPAAADTLHLAEDVTAVAHVQRVADMQSFIYCHAPQLLTASDYAHLDSLVTQPGFVARQIARCRQQLLLPASRFSHEGIRQKTPLQLFTPRDIGGDGRCRRREL